MLIRHFFDAVEMFSTLPAMMPFMLMREAHSKSGARYVAYAQYRSSSTRSRCLCFMLTRGGCRAMLACALLPEARNALSR